MSSSPADVILSFWSALARHDVARARAHLGEPLELCVAGVDGRGGAGYALALAEMMLGASVPLEIIASAGARVIVQRVGSFRDRYRRQPQLILALAEVRERRIVKWVEYRDPDQIERLDEDESAAWSVLEGEPAYRHAVRCLGASWSAKRA